MSRCAYATLVTSDAYALGALVLSASLRGTGTPHALVCMVSPGLTRETLAMLREGFDEVVTVAAMRSGQAPGDAHNLQLLGRPELDVTFSKLHAWTLTQWEKIAFLDADVLVLQNVDDLFERDELAAAPDCGWPDIFNSGVFVLRPSQETFERLVAMAASRGSWDGGDQGLLNDFFGDKWQRLPFVYNVTPTAVYTYAPAFQRFESDIKIVHFAGPNKPWSYAREADGTPSAKSTTPHGSVLLKLVAKWWSVFSAHESRWAHLFNPTSSSSSDASASAGAGQRFGGTAYTGAPQGAAGHGAGAGGLGGLKQLDPSWYAWPEDTLDSGALDAWKRAMSGAAGGRPPREAFRRRQSSGSPGMGTDGAPTPLPLGSAPGSSFHDESRARFAGAIGAPGDAPLRSPRSPLSTPLSENFAEALGGPFPYVGAHMPALLAAQHHAHAHHHHQHAHHHHAAPAHAAHDTGAHTQHKHHGDGSRSGSPVRRAFTMSPVPNAGDSHVPKGGAPIHFADADMSASAGASAVLAASIASAAHADLNGSGSALQSPTPVKVVPTMATQHHKVAEPQVVKGQQQADAPVIQPVPASKQAQQKSGAANQQQSRSNAVKGI